MSKMSNYLEVELRKHMFRTGSFTKPIALWVSLHTGSVQENGTGVEVSGGGYARKNLPPLDANWTAASATDGLTDNAAIVDFGTATADWGVIIDFGIWDAVSLGNLYCYGTLTVPKTVLNGDSFTFPVGALDITFA